MEDRPPADEAELVSRARRGDVAAFESLVAAHQEIAFRTAYVVIGDAAEAEDAAQEAFVMAVAGNFAEVTMIEGSDVPPVAGEDREFRFSLLQHGVTPVDHGRVALTVTLLATNERISVEATSAGGGEWIATVAFPVEGDWQLRITHSIFETPEPSTLTVGPAAGFAWLQGVSWLSGLALAVAAILGTLLLIGRARRPLAAEAKTTAVRAG